MPSLHHLPVPCLEIEQKLNPQEASEGLQGVTGFLKEGKGQTLILMALSKILELSQFKIFYIYTK